MIINVIDDCDWGVSVMLKSVKELWLLQIVSLLC